MQEEIEYRIIINKMIIREESKEVRRGIMERVER